VKLDQMLLAAIVVAASLTLLMAYDITGRAILADNQIFFFLSERAAAGVPPHISMADPKTQLSSLLTAVAIGAGHGLGLDTVMAFRAISIVSVLTSVWLAYRLAIVLSGHALAGPLAAAALFVVEGLFLEGASGGRPHVFTVTFILAAHLLMTHRRDVASGFAAACALLCWQPSAIVLGSIGLSLLLCRDAPIRRAVGVTAGALLAAAAYESYFVWHGVAGEQLFQEFVLPTGSIHEMASLAENFWFVITDARAYRPLPRLLPALFLLVVALRWLSWLARPRAALEAVRSRPEVTAFWLAAHLGFAFTVYEHQAHPDLLLVQPYYAVACAWLFAELVMMGAPARARLTAAWVVTAIVFGWGYAQGRLIARLTGPGAAFSLQDQRRMADAVRLYYDHRGSVWVLGSMHLLGLLHRDNWTQYGFFWDDLDRHMDTNAYRPERDGRMPEIILSGRGIVPGQAGWRRLEYLDITPPRFQVHNVRVFARRIDGDLLAQEAAAKAKAKAKAAQQGKATVEGRAVQPRPGAAPAAPATAP